MASIQLPRPLPASYAALAFGGILFVRGIYTLFRPANIARGFRVPLGPAPSAGSAASAASAPTETSKLHPAAAAGAGAGGAAATAYHAAIAYVKVQGSWYIGYGAAVVAFALMGDRRALGSMVAVGAGVWAIEVPIVYQHGTPRGWVQHVAACAQFAIVAAFLLF